MTDPLTGSNQALTSTAWAEAYYPEAIPERVWLVESSERTEKRPRFTFFPKDLPQILYVRADLVPQWKPIAEMPEELKDGRKVLLMAGFFDHGEQHLDAVPRLVVASYTERDGYWDIIDNTAHTISAHNPTHYFDFGTVALPTPPASEEPGVLSDLTKLMDREGVYDRHLAPETAEGA